MKLHIENIGMIEKADVEFNGITVICGENGTGKSIIGKSLFSMFSHFYQKNTSIYSSLTTNIYNILIDFMDRYSLTLFDTIIGRNKEVQDKALELADKISQKILTNKATNENIYKTIEIELNLKDNPKEDKEKFINDVLKNIPENLSKEDVEKNFLGNLFNNEFSNQINNLNKEDEIGKVSLFIKDKSIKVEIKNNEVINLEQNTEIVNNVIYLDSSYFPEKIPSDEELYPYFLSKLEYPLFLKGEKEFINHKKITRKMFFEENKFFKNLSIIREARLEKIMHLINKTNLSDIIFPEYENDDIFIKLKGIEGAVNIENIDNGLKLFILLKKILENGYIMNRDFLILDEPEIHMHPKWQLLFAEILIELQKEFNLTILINTHSPDFLDAIDTYAEKNEIKNKCKYYLAEDKTFFDKTDKLDDVYKCLCESLEILDSIKYE